MKLKLLVSGLLLFSTASLAVSTNYELNAQSKAELSVVKSAGGAENDMSVSGSYSATADHTYDVVILDNTGPFDTIKWRKDAGSYVTGAAISGQAIPLADGLSVNFSNLHGHVINDSWHVVAQLTQLLKLLDAAGVVKLSLSNAGVLVVSGATMSGSNSGDVTLGTANGLSLSGQILSLQVASNSVPGALSAADHTTFAATSAANTLDVSLGTSNGLSLTAQTLSLVAATDSVPGALSASDHAAFSAKQAAGNYITALTGDVTASGPGSVAATIANGAVTGAKLASNIAINTSVDAVIHSLAIGEGAGSITGNSALGISALNVNTTGNHNTGLGYLALRFNTTGQYNTGAGWGALGNVVSSTDNTAFGAAAGLGMTSGGDNTHVGSTAGYMGTTGSSNTSEGYAASYYNVTGSNNVGIGSSALYGVTGNSQSGNVAVGSSAMVAVTTGSNNVVIGFNAGLILTSGGTNVLIGHASNAAAATDTNSIVIGDSALGLGSNITVLGNSSTVQTQIFGAVTQNVLTVKPSCAAGLAGARIVYRKGSGGSEATSVCDCVEVTGSYAWAATTTLGDCT